VRRRNAQTPRDSVFAFARKLAAMARDGGHCVGEQQFHTEPARRRDGPHRLEQRLLADIGGNLGLYAGGIDVAQR